MRRSQPDKSLQTMWRPLEPRHSSEIAALFYSVFSESADEDEGILVSRLATDLVICTGSNDVYGFAAVDENQMLGAILFSRLSFDEPFNAFILSPVAVRSANQRSGVGQALITHGLREMTSQGVSYVVTYGDPSFYSKVGFHPLSTEVIQPPYRLSQPEGWLGQSLGGGPLEVKYGRASCVTALDDPAYW